jgi:hypothetical protein
MSIVASYSRTLPYVVVVQLNIILRFHLVQMIRSEAEAMKGADTVKETISQIEHMDG